jgi:hypothetical protein
MPYLKNIEIAVGQAEIIQQTTDYNFLKICSQSMGSQHNSSIHLKKNISCFSGFVLVIQEKDLVLLKVVKQRLRFQLRKDKESTAKLDKYRVRFILYNNR